MFFVVALSLVLLATFYLARRLVGGLHLSGPRKGLPEALEGFPLAQVSHLHMGPLGAPSQITRFILGRA